MEFDSLIKLVPATMSFLKKTYFGPIPNKGVQI